MNLGWEKALLGTVISTPSTMEDAADLLPADFTGCHQIIWAEVLGLYRAGGLDARTLIERLRQSGSIASISSMEGDNYSGENYLNYLIGYRGTAVDMYAKEVLSTSIKRQLREVSAIIRGNAESDRDAIEILDDAEKRLLGLRRDRTLEIGETLGDLLGLMNTRIDGMRNDTIQPAWVPKVAAVKDVIHYVDDDDFVLIASRPGEGKSSYMRYEFLMQAMRGSPVLLFNLENGPIEYAKFSVSYVTGIDSEKLKSPKLLTQEELERVREASEALATIPYHIITMGSPSIADVDRIARKRMSKHEISLIGLDYLQLVHNHIENKVQDVSHTSMTLRGMAMNYKVPVAANSQLNRDITKRGEGAEPELYDLRESGSLEQDATMVFFPVLMWKNPEPAQLRKFPENIDSQGNVYTRPKALPLRMKVAKNRNGNIGKSDPIKWVRSTNDFQTLVQGTNL